MIWRGVQWVLAALILVAGVWLIELVLWFLVLSPLYCLYRWFLA